MDWLSVLYTFCTLLFILGAVVLILVILVQKPQGGGLSAAFGAGGAASQTAFGAKTGDVLTLVTVGVFVFFLAISITMVLFSGALYGKQVEQTAPVTPATVAAVAKSPTSVVVTWDDKSDNEDSFTVQRADDPNGQWFTVGSAGEDEEEYTDGGVNPGTTYYYRVLAENQVGKSGETEPVEVTTPAAPESNPTGETPGASGEDGATNSGNGGGADTNTSGVDGTTDQPNDQPDSGNGG